MCLWKLQSCQNTVAFKFLLAFSSSFLLCLGLYFALGTTLFGFSVVQGKELFITNGEIFPVTSSKDNTIILYVPVTCSYEILVVAEEYKESMGGVMLYYIFFNVLLFFLLLLHIFWGWKILRMLISQIRAKGQVGDDVRSGNFIYTLILIHEFELKQKSHYFIESLVYKVLDEDKIEHEPITHDN